MSGVGEGLKDQAEVDRLLGLSVKADDAGEYDQAMRLMQQACEISKSIAALSAPPPLQAGDVGAMREARDRLAAWADALNADGGRMAYFGSPYAVDAVEQYWNRDLAKDLRAILALSGTLTPSIAGEEKLPPISYDGPHEITQHRRWLSRQLLDSKLSDEEAFGIVAYHPSIEGAGHFATLAQPLPTDDERRVKELEAGLWEIANSAGKNGERGTTGDGHQNAIQIARSLLPQEPAQ